MKEIIEYDTTKMSDIVALTRALESPKMAKVLHQIVFNMEARIQKDINERTNDSLAKVYLTLGYLNVMEQIRAIMDENDFDLSKVLGDYEY